MPSVYALASRHHNGREVLLARNNVIDFGRTLQPGNTALHIYENPGEYVIPGGEIRNGESPGRSALRVFCEQAQLPMPHVATLRQFHNTGEEAYFFLLPADDNRWLSLASDDELSERNRYFGERDGAVSVDPDTGRFVSSWAPENYNESHMLPSRGRTSV